MEKDRELIFENVCNCLGTFVAEHDDIATFAVTKGAENIQVNMLSYGEIHASGIIPYTSLGDLKEDTDNWLLQFTNIRNTIIDKKNKAKEEMLNLAKELVKSPSPCDSCDGCPVDIPKDQCELYLDWFEHVEAAKKYIEKRSIDA